MENVRTKDKGWGWEDGEGRNRATNRIATKIYYLTRYLLDQQEGVAEHLSERCTVHDGIFPFTVLDDIVGQVKKVEPVRGISC